jgi:predicted XRE-type DNA-binding protein
VSEYQDYEFKAIDRALTKAEMTAVRAISTRAVITSTSITNHYELGNFLGMHQPDVSNLLNGRVSKFSMSKLIKFAGKLNLGT